MKLLDVLKIVMLIIILAVVLIGFNWLNGQIIGGITAELTAVRAAISKDTREALDEQATKIANNEAALGVQGGEIRALKKDVAKRSSQPVVLLPIIVPTPSLETALPTPTPKTKVHIKGMP